MVKGVHKLQSTVHTSILNKSFTENCKKHVGGDSPSKSYTTLCLWMSENWLRLKTLKHINMRILNTLPRAHALVALPPHKIDPFGHRRHALKTSEVQS